MKIKKINIYFFLCLFMFPTLFVLSFIRLNVQANDDTGTIQTISQTDGDESSQPSDQLNNDQDDNKKKEKEGVDYLSILLGGFLTILGSIVTAVINNREAEKQRIFQMQKADEERKEARDKELKASKLQIYVEFIKTIRELNNSLENGEIAEDKFDNYFNTIYENYLRISLMCTETVINEANKVIYLIYWGMKKIPEENITKLIEAMCSDIKNSSSQNG